MYSQMRALTIYTVNRSLQFYHIKFILLSLIQQIAFNEHQEWLLPFNSRNENIRRLPAVQK